ncbi:MAG: T9SS type A sorting domain-containing protein [Bacteroidia bacterium]|nr:T9SS type A sorting domain-containing protein [Bacteroidia bacterium]HPE86689.1 T9SS type A sorting domain-containing protein [Bacteroidales bacterium]
MKNTISTICFCIISIIGYSQVWTEPVNISSMEGLDKNPSIAIDNNGNIHCTWVHDYGTHYKKIYYSHSDDNGYLWTNPQDISQNIDTWCDSPEIISDLNNTVYIFYNDNVSNPSESVVLMRYLENNIWSNVDTVTNEHPGSRNIVLIADNENKIFCFWYTDYNNGSSYYKYYHNNTWSQVFQVHPGPHQFGVSDAVVDLNNDIHIISFYHEEYQTYNDDKYVYSKLNNEIWSPIDFISPHTIGGGAGIDVDEYCNPHIVFRQEVSNDTINNDSTMYRYYDGICWSDSEVVVIDPMSQRIEIDELSHVHLFDVEKSDEGSYLVHHNKVFGEWNSQIICSSPWNIIHYDILMHENFLYAVFLAQNINNNDADIFISKFDYVSSIEEKEVESFSCAFFPNPFSNNTTISVSSMTLQPLTVKIYNLNGQLVRKFNTTDVVGTKDIIWDGTDTNGNKVNNGTYLVRVLGKKKILSRLLYLIK